MNKIDVSYGWAIRFLKEMNPKGNPDPADVGMAIGKVLSMATINATPKQALLNALRYCARVMHLEEWLENAEMLPREKPRSMTKWIPIRTRPMDEEERKEWSERIGYDLQGDDGFIYCCPLPEHGQQAIFCSSWGRIWVDTFENDPDYGCSLEENGDLDGVVAWMPLPKPYEGDDGKEGPACTSLD